MQTNLHLLHPDWPAPRQIRAAMTLRTGGHSRGAYESWNLGAHCGDDAEAVAKNRALLTNSLSLPSPPVWLRQTHSIIALEASHYLPEQEADASFTRENSIVCAVMTADCLPVLICNRAGTEIAAIHAGWRGMADGIIEQTITKLESAPKELLVWFGAAIGPTRFEVGEEVIPQFTRDDPNAAAAFSPSDVDADKWFGNLYQLAQNRCQLAGVASEQCFGDWSRCTHTEQARFFSYRRDNITGRMATLIWIQHDN